MDKWERASTVVALMSIGSALIELWYGRPVSAASVAIAGVIATEPYWPRQLRP